MPVWHELTRLWRSKGSLRIVGLAQEQHPERCQLFAQWKDLDWPILWDPFNLSGSSEVPHVIAVDEHGIVRAIDPEPETFAQTFLARSFEAPAARAEEAGMKLAPEVQTGGEAEAEPDERGALERARAALLAREQAELSPHVDTLAQYALRHPGDARAQFQAGVALRMRYDSPEVRATDFQDAVDCWTNALALEPGQYIWRRRIQQYGPRMDKPYSFYGWIESAQTEVRRRGLEPLALSVELTPAELAQPRRGFAQPERVEPDPEGKVPRDLVGWIQVETAVTFSTEGARRTASLHVALRPDRSRAIHWGNEAGALELWIGQRDLPSGWTLSERRFTRQPVGPETSDEVRRFHLELDLAPDAPSAGEISGYVLFHACEGPSGACTYRRRDFSFAILAPQREAK